MALLHSKTMLVVIKAKAQPQIDFTKDTKSWQHMPMAGSSNEYYTEGLLSYNKSAFKS